MTTAPLRILVVDDNVDTARMLKILLRCEGHDARIAFDGPAAIEEARTSVPDVVLLDLTLPSMSGCDVAATLRTLPELSACRLVALSGHAEDRMPSPSPFDRHFQKPVAHDDLLGYLTGIAALLTPSLPTAVS
jgi:CheY-like chemotaxis protein